MSRIPLPARRYAESFDIEHDGHGFHIAIGALNDDGAPGEIFVNAHKVDSELDNLAADIAILISLLLQHGASAATIGHTLRRNPNSSRASLAGILVDHVAAHQFAIVEQAARGVAPGMIAVCEALRADDEAAP